MESLRNKAYLALRRSESFFRTDMVYLAKGGSWLSLSHGVAIVSGFLISIAFANLFPKESFGTYKYILSMVGIIGAFSLTGIGPALTQAVTRGNSGALGQGFRLNLKWSVGVLLAGIALGIYYFINGNTLLAYSFIVAGIFSPLTASASLYAAFLLGKKDFRRSSLYSMVQNTVPTAAIVLALYLTQSVPVIISVYFVFGTVVLFFLYRKTLNAYKNDNRLTDPELSSYSGHLSAMEIIGRVASHLDKILIFHYLGAAPLAIYAFAIAPVEQLQSGKKIISTLIMPKLSARPFEELQKSAPRKALLMSVYALLLAGIWILVAPYFYKLLFPQYLDSVFYSQIYSLTLLAIAGTLFNDALIAHKKKRELYFHRTVMPILQIVLFIILLPLYGLMGLIITHVSIRIFNGLLGYYLVSRPLSK